MDAKIWRVFWESNIYFQYSVFCGLWFSHVFTGVSSSNCPCCSRFDKPHYPPKQIFVSDKMAEQPELISDNLLEKARENTTSSWWDTSSYILGDSIQTLRPSKCLERHQQKQFTCILRLRFAHLISYSLNSPVVFVAGRLLLHVRSCSGNALCTESTQGSVGTAWWPGCAALRVEALPFAKCETSEAEAANSQHFAVSNVSSCFKTFCQRTLKPFEEQHSQTIVPPSNRPCEPERFNCISAVWGN